MSVDHLLDRGKEAHNQKQYAEAVEHFTKAISISPSDLKLQLLATDLRCLSYSKLGNQAAALYDAKRLIHLTNKRGHTGYLRCSQIERLLGNFDAARRWLEHGLKYVSSEHKVIFKAQLKKVEENARIQDMNRKRQDPISSMPLEILQLILYHLDYREVTCLLRVSPTWRTLLSTMPPLTTAADFTGARKSISYEACNAVFRRLCRQPRKIVLCPTVLSATNFIISWMSKSTNIESLETIDIIGNIMPLHRVKFDKLPKLQCLRLGRNQRTSIDQMLNIIHNCPNLEKLVVCLKPSLDTLPRKEHLRLQHLTFLNDDFRLVDGYCFVTLLGCYPNLQCLEIQGKIECSPLLDLSKLQHLKCLRLSHLSNSTEIQFAEPSELEELVCGSGYSMWDLGKSKPLNLPNLRLLVAGDRLRPAFFRQLETSTHPPKLREVRLTEVDSSVLHSGLFTSCNRVELCLTNLVDNMVGTFIACFPAVEYLVLEAPAITGVFISDLVKIYKSQLNHITLKGCRKVSPDIEKWLDVQGISNRIVKVDETKGAFRVRDAWY